MSLWLRKTVWRLLISLPKHVASAENSRYCLLMTGESPTFRRRLPECGQHRTVVFRSGGRRSSFACHPHRSGRKPHLPLLACIRAGVEAGQIYGCRAFGPFEPDWGLRFEPSKLLLGELSPFSPDSLPNLQQTIVVIGFFGSDCGHRPAPARPLSVIHLRCCKLHFIRT